MAGGNATPRQKMINMMYLVLTAILALNVSKDILEVFVVVNEGLEHTVDNFIIKNDNLYEDLDIAKGSDPVRVTPYWKRAQQVRTLTDEMCEYITELKKELIMATEQVDEAVADTITLDYVDKKDNYMIPSNILIGNSEDGSAGRSRELRERIEKYREQITLLLDEEARDPEKVGLFTEGKQTEDGFQNWEMINFYHTPLAADVTILSQLQAQLRSAEYYAINHFIEESMVEPYPIDTIAAKVIPNSNYVMLGEEYKADVFLAAFSTTNDPEMVLGDLDTTGKLLSVSDSLNVKKGMGQYIVKTDKEGFQEYGGVVRWTNRAGEMREFPFRSDYLVARPSLVVSPTKMNVLYKGIMNPIKVSVPGVASEDLSVNITGGNRLRKVGTDEYEVHMSGSSLSSVDVQVTATLPSGERKSMGAMNFRVKQLPKPYVRMKEITTTGTMCKTALAAEIGMRAEYDRNFQFDLSCKVRKFKMSCIYRGAEVEYLSNSYQLTSDMKAMIRQLPKGTKVHFFDIEAVGEDKVRHKMPGITITIVC